MGDRANVAVAEGESRVYLYTHWGGYNLAETVATALRRRERWYDRSYLARIVFDTMSADRQGESTGFGISTHIEDNEHPIIVLNTDREQVTLETEDAAVMAGPWSFDAIAIDPADFIRTYQHRAADGTVFEEEEDSNV